MIESIYCLNDSLFEIIALFTKLIVTKCRLVAWQIWRRRFWRYEICEQARPTSEWSLMDESPRYRCDLSRDQVESHSGARNLTFGISKRASRQRSDRQHCTVVSAGMVHGRQQAKFHWVVNPCFHVTRNRNKYPNTRVESGWMSND